jgi:hypothetical protein
MQKSCIVHAKKLYCTIEICIGPSPLVPASACCSLRVARAIRASTVFAVAECLVRYSVFASLMRSGAAGVWRLARYSFCFYFGRLYRFSCPVYDFSSIFLVLLSAFQMAQVKRLVSARVVVGEGTRTLIR